MAKLNPDQFPVIRRSSFSSGHRNMAVGPAYQYVAVHPETGKAVGTVTRTADWISTRTDKDFDKLEADESVRPGTDIPMFDLHQGVVEDFAVEPRMKGKGVGRHLLNHLVEDQWRSEGREVGTVPGVSTSLSPDSAGVVEHYTGQKPEEKYWTDGSIGRQGRTESDEEYAGRVDRVRSRRMRDFAKDNVEMADAVSSGYSPGMEPGTRLPGLNRERVVAQPTTSSLDQKLEAVAAKDRKPVRRKKGDDGQMTLPLG